CSIVATVFSLSQYQQFWCLILSSLPHHLQHFTFWHPYHQEKGQPLPKFGEWDVNNPASAEGFTVIFNKARDEKKTGGNSGASSTPPRNIGGLRPDDTYHYPRKSRKWFCCG
ncbi:hypothetical protein B296_00046506, partial [Ensete ventricosum]